MGAGWIANSDLSLDLRKFDAWKKFQTYSPKWSFDGWFTMVESKNSPTKQIKRKGRYF